MQRGSGARIRVTTDGGSTWTSRSVGSLANAFRMVWAGDRLVVIADIGSVVRLYRSDDYGATWSNTSFSQAGTNRSTNVEVIRTGLSGLLFAFANDPGAGAYLLRSTDNGSSWANIGSFGGSGAAVAIVYDHQSGQLYYGTPGELRRLPAAGTRDWAGVTSSDWVTLPTLGANLGKWALALDGGNGGGSGLLGP